MPIKLVPKRPKKKEYSDPYMDPNHPMNRERTGPSTMQPIEKDSKTRKPIIKKKAGGKVGKYKCSHNRLY